MELTELSSLELLRLCEGADCWHTRAVPGLGLHALRMADGPHGLRRQERAGDMLGMNASKRATCFPTAALTACGWDEALLFDIGAALGREARAEGVGLLLGPGANLKRGPLCGRNFEYFSEDPLLTGRLAAAFIRGVQSEGVGACLKHFAGPGVRGIAGGGAEDLEDGAGDLGAGKHGVEGDQRRLQ